jgi:hypothetical protein
MKVKGWSYGGVKIPSLATVSCPVLNNLDEVQAFKCVKLSLDQYCPIINFRHILWIPIRRFLFYN